MARRIDTQARNEAVRFEEQGGDPAQPAAGYRIVYAKAGGIYEEDDTGAVVGPFGAGGGSIATDAIWDAAGDLVKGTGANTADRLAIGTYPQILRVNSGATAPEWVSAGKVLISEQTPTTTTTVTWSSIPATYKHLEIYYIARSTKAAAYEDISLLFNNDSTANNYSYAMLFGYSNNDHGSQSTGSGSVVGVLSGNNSSAGQATSGKIIIPYYQTSFFKQTLGEFTHARDQSGVYTLVAISGTSWESTDAITRIDMVLASGNYAAGSTFALYGVF